MTTAHLRILAISLACMLYPCLVDSASAQAPQTSYMFCRSVQANIYYSGIFVIDPSIDGDFRAWNAAIESERASGGHIGAGPAPWVERFNQFITQTYANSRKDGSSCDGFRTLADAQQKLDDLIRYDQKRDKRESW